MNIISPNLYGKLSNESLAIFEENFRISLPHDYRNFLLQYNGGKWDKKLFNISNEYGDSLIHHVYGIHDGPEYLRLDKILVEFQNKIDSNFLPIADDDGGNQVCIGIHDKLYGKIYFWDHESGNLIKITDGFNEFVESLKEIATDTNEIDRVLEEDDVTQMSNLISAGYNLEGLDENGRSLIERAVINAKPKLVEFLMLKGVKLRSSLVLAEKNAEYFDEHKAIVELLKKYLGSE